MGWRNGGIVGRRVVLDEVVREVELSRRLFGEIRRLKLYTIVKSRG